MSEGRDSRKIRALVIDDEPLARSNLAVLLRGDAQIGSITECGSGSAAIEEIRNTKPDLVFLDIQMPECDGFEVLEALGSDRPRAIVFVTAYDEHAVRAFAAGVLDYLLKPFDDARFNLTMARAKAKLAQHKAATVPQTRIAIRSAGHLSFVKISDIDWIEAADYYACLHVGAKTHLVRRRMSELARELDSRVFCRIHRSTIVNLDRVRRLELDRDGEYKVILDGGTRLSLSRRFRKALQSCLGGGDSDAAAAILPP